MQIKSNKPPDPLFDVLCTLTKMTSTEYIRDASLKDTKVKVVMGKLRKPSRGIKISTPGSAGAGSILRRVQSAKVSGRARERVDRSSVDFRGGKRVSAAPANDEISQVLSNIKAENFSRNEQGSPVAKSCGLKTSLDHSCMGDVGNTRSGLTSSKDGIAIAKTGNLDGLGMADKSRSSSSSISCFFSQERKYTLDDLDGWVSLRRLRSDAVTKVLTPSLGIVTPSPDTLRNSLKPLRVKLQSHPVSSQIESKSRVYPPKASQMLKHKKK
nr:hypothetical protein [Tanacetum cinerariifolium]